MGALVRILMVLLLCSAAQGAEYRRIACFYDGHAQNLAALGGGDRLVAVAASGSPQDFPGLARLSPRASPEEVLALRPDLVLMRPFNRQANPGLVEALERFGVAVVLMDPPSWEGFDDYLVQLAQAVGGLDSGPALARAAELRRSLAEGALAALEGRSGPRVFLEATARELRTCAPGSWAARLIELAGGRNVAASARPLRPGSPLAHWGPERLLEAASEEIDFYLIQQGPMNRRSPQELKSQPWFQALGDLEVLAVPERWISRPSLESLEKGGQLLLRSFFGPLAGTQEARP